MGALSNGYIPDSPCPLAPNHQTGGSKSPPLKLQPNRRPQIEHIMWQSSSGLITIVVMTLLILVPQITSPQLLALMCRFLVLNFSLTAQAISRRFTLLEIVGQLLQFCSIDYKRQHKKCSGPENWAHFDLQPIDFLEIY